MKKFNFSRETHELYLMKNALKEEYETCTDSMEDVYRELYKVQKKISEEELLVADSAEPKSIADFRAYGAFIRGAEKGPDSVRYSIKWLQGLRKIYIDKRRCPETYREFIGYEYLTDKDGNFYSAYPDADNHNIDAVRYATERIWRKRGK